VFSVHDWAEVRRLHHREHLSKSVIAKRLGMSRPTVIRLLELADPPRYERRPVGSKLDPTKIRSPRCSTRTPRSQPR
jgi:IS30 family transposase